MGQRPFVFGAVLFVACASQEAPRAPPPPVATVVAKPAPTGIDGKTDQQILDEFAARRVERARRDAEIRQAREDERKRQIADAEEKRAEDARQEKARADKYLDDRCDQSRIKRAHDASAEAVAWVTMLKRIAPVERSIRSQCTRSDSRGVKYERERDGDGVIVRSRAVGREDDVKCRGALPRQITMVDVHYVLYEMSAEFFVGSPLFPDENDPTNSMCRTRDAALGLVIELANNDMAGIARLVAWRSAAPIILDAGAD